MSHYYRTSKIFLVLLVAIVFGSVPFLHTKAAEDVLLDATYVGGSLNGQIPEGGLEPNSNIKLQAIFMGDPNACINGNHLFRTMVHAKDGNVNNNSVSNYEYLARGTAGAADEAVFTYTFNSGSAGQHNAYWPVFYCWTSDNPSAALGRTLQWMTSAFVMDTVGGRCTLSSPVWETQGTVSAGSQATMSVNGSLGCGGRNFDFEIWTTGLGGIKVATIPTTFPTSGSAPYTVKKTWKVAEDQDYIFKARVPDPNGSVITSATLKTGSSEGGAGGGGTTQSFELQNPIGVSTFQDLVGVIGTWIFNLAIPIAVIVIIYAGMLMLTAGNNPAKFNKGKDALKYAVIGLAIVLIGKGFVSLIQSILSLKK